MYNSKAARAEVIALLLLICSCGRYLPPAVWHFGGPIILIHLVVTIVNRALAIWMACVCASNLRYVVDDVDVVIYRLVLPVVRSWTSSADPGHPLIHHSLR